MAEIEMEGKTVQEAIESGLKKLGLSKDQVEVKILSEGTSGLFGLMGNKSALVRLTAKDSDCGSTDLALAQEKTKEVLCRLLDLMKFSYKSVTTALMAGRILADIRSDESSLVIGRNGQTLNAIETVLNLMVSKDKETRIRISVDCDKFREKYEDKVREMASEAADKVRKTGNPFWFESMPARDRRIVHEFLKGDADLESVSEGEGIFRKLCIKTKEKK